MERQVVIPEAPMAILKTLERHGYEAYVVGGCVRDALLGRAPHDWDIVTSARPAETLSCFDRSIGTGLRHGTVTVVTDAGQYEVTTFRVDGAYSDGRHPDRVTFTRDIADDLGRRDFTMNAVAADSKGNIIDPYNGTGDIAARLIRCVGDAKARFSEDALRILRALRFSAQLGFHMDPPTARAIHACKGLLGHISRERINREFTGMLCGGFAHRVLIPYADVISEIVPEAAECAGFAHAARAVRNIEPDPILRLAVFFYDIGKPRYYTQDSDGTGRILGHAAVSAEIARGSMTRLRFSREIIDAVTELVEYHDVPLEPSPRCVLRLLSRIGETQLCRLLKVREADVLARPEPGREHELDVLADVRATLRRVLEEHRPFAVRDLSVGGADLMAAGIPQGPEIGRVLSWLLGEVMDGLVKNGREQLLRHLAEKRPTFHH